jgi:hypothetical protein
MAKQRKRFYVAIHANDVREVISMKYRNEWIDDCLTWDKHSSTITQIIGPFKTFDDACLGLLYKSGQHQVNTIRYACVNLSKATGWPIEKAYDYVIELTS